MKLAAILLFLSSSLSAEVWRSDGWGYVYRIEGAAAQAFEVTSTTCVRAPRPKGVDIANKRVMPPDSLAYFPIEPLPELPAACRSLTPNTPQSNFEVFVRTFSENYISFDLRQVDWDRAVAQQRAKVTSQTTPAQLFDIFKGLVEPLGDMHVGMSARRLHRNLDGTFRPGSDRVVRGNIERFAKQGRRELSAVTDRAYFSGAVRSYCHGEWQYGRTPDGVGYLRILGFGGYARRGGYPADVRALNLALDEILGDSKLRALIIDVRLSFGGDDRLGLAIAARLTDREYHAYSIQARSGSRFSPLQPIPVRRGTKPVFTGPVVELTGPITMSAAETFTQALMERTPHVTRIGENTQGVFCDVLERHLPNGWTFALPNAVYRSSQGIAFDVNGIPPDIVIPVFADEDVAAGRDAAMAAALQILK